MKYALVIPTYNDWESLKKLLDIVKLQLLNHENSECWKIVVVDNGSDSPNPFSLEYQFVDWLYCEIPGSYAARNYAIRKVDADIYCFTDSDCILADNYFNSVELKSCENSSASVLTAGNVRMFPGNKHKLGFFESYDFVFGLPQHSYVRKGYAVTANLIVPKYIFDTIGVFDSSHFSGGDHDFCTRATKAGFELIFSEEIEVRHPCRVKLNEYTKKIRRVVGAQVDRRSTIGKCGLLVKAIGIPIVTSAVVFNGSKSKNVRVKLLFSIWVLAGIRVYVLLSAIIGFSSKQR